VCEIERAGGEKGWLDVERRVSVGAHKLRSLVPVVTCLTSRPHVSHHNAIIQPNVTRQLGPDPETLRRILKHMPNHATAHKEHTARMRDATLALCECVVEWGALSVFLLDVSSQCWGVCVVVVN
jgi:hypothetical protein